MTRRTALVLPMALAAQDPREAEMLANEFGQLYNDFVADLNILMSGHIRGKWDRELAAKVEKDFERLTGHVAWITPEKRKRKR